MALVGEKLDLVAASGPRVLEGSTEKTSRHPSPAMRLEDHDRFDEGARCAGVREVGHDEQRRRANEQVVCFGDVDGKARGGPHRRPGFTFQWRCPACAWVLAAFVNGEKALQIVFPGRPHGEVEVLCHPTSVSPPSYERPPPAIRRMSEPRRSAWSWCVGGGDPGWIRASCWVAGAGDPGRLAGRDYSASPLLGGQDAFVEEMPRMFWVMHTRYAVRTSLGRHTW